MSTTQAMLSPPDTLVCSQLLAPSAFLFFSWSMRVCFQLWFKYPPIMLKWKNKNWNVETKEGDKHTGEGRARQGAVLGAPYMFPRIRASQQIRWKRSDVQGHKRALIRHYSMFLCPRWVATPTRKPRTETTSPRADTGRRKELDFHKSWYPPSRLGKRRCSIFWQVSWRLWEPIQVHQMLQFNLCHLTTSSLRVKTMSAIAPGTTHGTQEKLSKECMNAWMHR